MAYRGDKVENQRVDRPDEGLATEHAGPGGTGTARATLDSGRAGPSGNRTAKSVLDTTGIGMGQSDATKRAIDSA